MRSERAGPKRTNVYGRETEIKEHKGRERETGEGERDAARGQREHKKGKT